MQVRRSCYYSWRVAASYGLSTVKTSQAARLKECFYFHRRRYGSRRIAAALSNRATSSSFRDETGRFEGDCSRCVLCRAPPIQITAWQSAPIFCRTRQTRHLIKVKFLSATLLIGGCGAAAFVIWLAFRINSRAALSVGKSRSE